jgi:biotin carboxyl carrier protein
MSDKSVGGVILEVRALLEQFRHSVWRDVHVRTNRYDVFIAKAGGVANPLRRAATPPAAVSDARPPVETMPIVAPHLGTVAWVESAGGPVESGAVVARIEVLGELIEIAADVAGRIHAVAAPVGVLVEFGATIATLVAHDA